MRRCRGRARVAVVAVVAMVLSVAVPSGLPVAGGGFPLSGLWSVLSAVPAFAASAATAFVGGGAVAATPAAAASVTAQADPGSPRAVPPERRTEKPWTTPDLATSTKFDPATSVKVPERSTEKSDTYRNSDGSYSAVLSTEPVNFRGADGSWTPIDTRLRVGGDGRLRAVASPADVSFSESAAAQSRTSTSVAGGSQASGLGAVTFPGGQRLEFSLLGAAGVSGVVTDRTVTYPGVLPDTDLVLAPTASGLKETIVLNSPAAANSWLFGLGLYGLTPRLNAAGSVELLDADGAVAGLVPAGFMEDASFDRLRGTMTSSTAVTYELTSVDGAAALRMTADRAWLDDPARVYPVRVDPSSGWLFGNDDAFIDNDPSTGPSQQNGRDLTVGTYDGGTHIARSYVKFDGFSTALQGRRITAGKLDLFLSWTFDCAHPTPVNVYQVTSNWTGADLADDGLWGPNMSTLMGSGAPGSNYPACTNTSGDRSVGQRYGIALDVATLNEWSRNPSSNMGFALVAPDQANSYQWKRFTSRDFNESYGPAAIFDYQDVAPELRSSYPPAGAAVGTLTPQLSADAVDPDAFPQPVTYEFSVQEVGGTNPVVAQSAATTTKRWTVPGGALQWGKTYVWRVIVSDGGQAIPADATTFPFTTQVPQTLVTSGLSQNGGEGFAPDGRNYTASATDATVATVGPALSVQRSYNSLDPRTSGAFGAGWSTIIDSAATERRDGGVVQAVVVTYPAGQEVAFGRNADGTFAAPMGRFATLVGDGSSGYRLTDKDGTVYAFTASVGTPGRFGLASVTDASGRPLTLARDGSGRVVTMTSASGRALTLTWSTPPGAGSAHVASVTTPQATPGDPQTAAMWTYAYTGDLLTSVCAPSATGCTTYTYGTTTRYPGMVADTGARSYWRLGDATGPVARSTVLDNGGLDNGTYVSVTAGQAGPLAGASGANAAAFSSGSAVTLPRTAAVTQGNASVSLWFKTTGAGPLWGESSQPFGSSTIPGYMAAPLYVGTDGKLRGGLPTLPTPAAVVGLAGKCLDNYTGSGTNGNPIHLYTCNGGANSQLWSWYPDGTLRIAGKCLDEEWYGTANGSKLFLWDCHGQSNQVWKFVNGTLRNALSGRCVDVPYSNTGDAAVQLQLWDCLGGANQQWSAPALPTPITSTVTVTDGAWHHAVLSAAGSTQTLYLDGLSVGTLAGEVRHPDTAYAMIGAGYVSGMLPSQQSVGWQSLSGSIAEVSVWDHPVTAADVESLRSAALTVALPLTSVVRPSGNATARVEYNTPDGTVRKVTDANGGVWQLASATVGGSYQVHASAVLGAGPSDYWRLADNQVIDPVNLVTNQVNGGTATYSAVTLNKPGGPFDKPDETVPQDNTTVAQFNGSSSHILMPPADVPRTGPTSIAMWFKLDVGRSGVLFGYQTAPIATDPIGGWVPAIYVGTDGKLRAQLWNNNLNPMTSTASVADNTWHHVVLAASGTSQDLYLDGVKLRTVAGNLVDFGASSAQVGAGKWTNWPGASGSSIGYWPGQIAEVSYYRSQLSAGQVSAQFNARQNSTGGLARSVTVTDPGNHTVTYLTDMAGRKLADIDALGHKTQYGYDKGFLHTVTDPNGNVTTTEQDARGNTTSSKTCQKYTDDPGGCSIVYFTYFLDSTASPSTDPRNDLMVTMRDGRSTDANDNRYKTSFEYDASGNRTKVTDPVGRQTITTYTTKDTPAAGGGTTPPGLPLTVTTPGGAVQTATYFASGDLATMTDPAGKLTSYTYDGAGRVASQTVTTSTFPNGLQTTMGYDPAGRVAWQQTPPVTNRVTGAVHTARVNYVYDDDNEVRTQTVADLTGGDASRTTTWDYNSYGQQIRAIDPAGHQTSVGYDAFGRIVSETDPNGKLTRSEYDAKGHLTKTILSGYTGDPNNPSPATDLVLTQRFYDLAGRLTKVVDANGAQTVYTYTDNDLVLTVTLTSADGSSSFVQVDNTYDKAGNITRTKTNNAITVTDYTLDEAGRTTRTSVDPGGSGAVRATEQTLSPDNFVTQERRYEGTTLMSTTDMTYDPLGRVLTSTRTDPTLGPVTTTWTRDQAGLVTAETDPAGNTTDYSLDETGRTVVSIAPATMTETEGGTALSTRAVSYTGYNTFGEATESKDANGNVSVTDFNAAGDPTTTTLPDYTPPGSSTPIVAQTHNSYDNAGQLLSATDPLGHSTGYTYDQLGRVAKLTAADDTTSRFGYDLAGNQTSATDATGARTEADYDYLGRQTKTRQVVRQTGQTYETKYEYAQGGWLSKTTSPTGIVVTTTYNNVGQPLSVADSGTTTFAYDGLGRLSKTTEPDNSYTTLTYNGLGWVTGQTSYDPAGVPLKTTSVGYDKSGHVVASTDPRGHTSTVTYDATGLPTSYTQAVNNTDSISTSFGYDIVGNRTRFTDGRGNEFLTTYNTWGLPESQIEPATTEYPGLADRSFTTAYDAAGRPVVLSSPGGVSLTNTYNTLNQLTDQTGTGAEVPTTARHFGYDPAGRLATVSGPGGDNTFGYDDRGLLVSTTGGSGTASFAYNGDAAMTRRTDAAGTTDYTYDTFGRLRTVSNPTTGVSITDILYNNMSMPVTMSFGSGADTRTFTYDSSHRMIADELKTAIGASAAKIEYQWDANDNETQKTVTGFGTAPLTNTYTYDFANRLTSWDNGVTPVVYAYDKSGNRVQAGTTVQTYNQRNQLIESGGTDPATYTYTPRGTLSATLASTNTVLTKADAFDQIIYQDAPAGGQHRDYAYDGLGRLIRNGAAFTGPGNDLATDAGTSYTRDPAGNLLGVANGTTQRLAWTDAHTDVVAQFTASASSLAATATYDPLGRLVAGTGMTGTLGYQSEYTDPATGQVNMAARWYNPATGVFSTRDSFTADPTGPSIGANRYAYGDGNPLTVLDPTGHFGLGSLLKKAASAVVNTVKAAVTVVATTVSVAYTSAARWVEDRIDDVKRYAQQALQAAKTIVTAVVNTAKTVVKKVVKAAAKATQWVAEKANQVATIAKAVIVDVGARGLAAVQNAQRNIAATVYSIADAYNDAKNWVVEHKDTLIEVAAIGLNIVAGIACAGAGPLAIVCMAGTSALINFAKDAAQGNIHSLNDVWASVGTGALQGVAGVFGGAVGGRLASAALKQVGNFAFKLGGRMLGGAIAGGASDAVTQLATTNTIDFTGVATSAAIGAIFGAAGGRAGRGRPNAADGEAPPPRRGGGDKPNEPEPTRNSADEPASGKPKACTPGCECNSFAAGTLVLLADGTTKPIEDLTIGDKVTATDPVTGQTEAEPVTQLHLNRDTDLVDITVNVEPAAATGKPSGQGNGDRSTRGPTRATIQTTAAHPFWDNTTKQWTNAADLKPGQTLLSADNAVYEIADVTPVPGTRNMHNLTIANIHTYYVLAGDTPVLVHNCDPSLEVRTDMANSGMRPGRGGKADTTQAGLKYDRHQLDPAHPNDPKRFLPRVGSATGDLDNAGQRLLDDIALHPMGKQEPVTAGIFRNGGMRIIRPDGVGAVFDADGVFQYFGSFTYPGT